RILFKILTYMFIFELVGTLFLYLAMRGQDGATTTTLWRAFFTAVSAFCNAGFALQPNSLVGYQTNPAFTLTVSILIIAGSFSPLLVLKIPSHLYLRKLTLQDKVVLTTTGVLLISAYLIYLGVEWNYSLASLSWPAKDRKAHV